VYSSARLATVIFHNPSVEVDHVHSARCLAARKLEILKSTSHSILEVLVCSRKNGEYFLARNAPRRGLAKFDSHNCYMSDQTFMNFVAQKYSLALAILAIN